MKKISLTALAVFVLIFMFMSAVQAQSPQQTLNQYISDLQKNPNDYALREKIIRHVQTMTTAPAIPEEARRHYVMALTLFKGAKKVEDYNESIEELRSALLIAPWWADANRDLGMALESAKRYDDAISALKLYMASRPGDEKARAAQDEIYKIEGMKKLAAREREESSPAAIAEKKRQTEKEFIEKLNGAHYVLTKGTKGKTIDILGNKLIFCARYKNVTGYPNGRWRYQNETTLNGREFDLTLFVDSLGLRLCQNELNFGLTPARGKISDDGNSIDAVGCDGDIWTYRREEVWSGETGQCEKW